VCIYCAGQGSCSPVQELVLCLLWGSYNDVSDAFAYWLLSNIYVE
jgi:hypothetical protein